MLAISGAELAAVITAAAGAATMVIAGLSAALKARSVERRLHEAERWQRERGDG